MATTMQHYRHTQHAPLHVILYLVAAATVVGAGTALDEPFVAVMLLGMSVLFVLVGLCFAHLTVEDEGQHLLLHYGPLRLFRKRIAYADITAVERGRSSWIDGWGIHYIIGRGWTYNLWGFDCVKLTLGKKIIRIGTDDAAGLEAFLKNKVEPA